MKLWVYLAVAGLLAGAVWYQVALHKKAARVDAAEQRADDAEKRALNIAETAAKAAAQERETAATMAAVRGELSAQAQAFREALARKPLVLEVPRVDPKTGQTVTCRERDPVRYRELFNQAVTGATGS